MRIGILAEATIEDRPRDDRVALTPTGAAKLVDQGHEVVVEAGAGAGAGHPDEAYRQAGADIASTVDTVGSGGVLIRINGPTPGELADPAWAGLGPAHQLIGLHDPLWRPERATALADTGATAISLELIPRITRAQSMDVLSSMATVAGYEAVLLAASRSPRMLPMLMTAAGTVPPTRFLVLGAGVAGLQAIATARRLGAAVSGYDVRPAAMEQIESLGAKAVELVLDEDEGAAVEDAGGYAARQSEDRAQRQLELLAPHVAEADVVITTAAIPGAASPRLITEEAIAGMTPGSVVVDLAAERGGNSPYTRADAEVEHDGVLILGPTDLASRSAATASQMFSNNVTTLLGHLAPDGDLALDFDDEITAGTVLTVDGTVRHPMVRDRLGLAPIAEPDATDDVAGAQLDTESETAPDSDSDTAPEETT
jgi:NAD(P) transhydrogenase subunit alpha